jgi:hypothetical protein
MRYVTTPPRSTSSDRLRDRSSDHSARVLAGQIGSRPIALVAIHEWVARVIFSHRGFDESTDPGYVQPVALEREAEREGVSLNHLVVAKLAVQLNRLAGVRPKSDLDL